jgi:1,4-dihydroxy-2-naphthoyl-CoA synthase
LDAVANAARAIMLGEADVYVGGGVESMSRAPWAVPKPERAFPTGSTTIYDTTLGWRFVNPKVEEMGHTDSLGMTAAMACDIRIASENARFGLPETALSIIPGAGGTQRLARLVGKVRALELILTGRAVDAEEARAIGLVTKVVPQAGLMDAARETAGQILSKGPLAVRLARLAVQTGFETDRRTGLVVERLAQALLYTSEDKCEGTSAFIEKRKPDFKGR